ncbi:MAG: 16S rRNA (cytosine(967)-C(5))-methyltransferase RsmB, partial [Oscillospiraceae bacterium]|nr:16S rRNA (cytosine(967)-C(5))-methyltransferase RsmB [Oscillospiraceae bacterium]
MSARTTALSALIACRRQNGWSDGVLKSYIERDRLDRRDAALASRLCYGVLQNRMLLDHYLSACLDHGMAKLQPVVADILRLGAYQILFLDRVPNAAAVDEAVQQGKKYANRQAAGLINAVLRALTRKAESIPMPASLALRYSHSEELVSLLADSIGSEELEALLACNNEAPEATLQTNLLRVSQEEAALALEAEGV